MAYRVPTAVRALAGHHLRRSRFGAIAAVIFIGLLAGLPMTVMAAARYADGATERFLEYSDAPDFVVYTCPPGVSPEEGIDACAVGVDLSEPRRVMSGMNGVESAHVGGFIVARGGASSDPASWGPPTGGLFTEGSEASAAGRPLVVRGRLADRSAPDEVMLTEASALRFGLEVGEIFHLADPEASESFPSEVVGIIRTVDDVVPVPDVIGATFFVREGWFDAHADQVLAYRSVLVDVEDGISLDDFRAELGRALPDQFANVEELLAEDQLRTSREAVDLERRAVAVLAGLAGVGAAFLCSQVVLRISRSEIRDDDSVLRSLGATTGMFRAVVGLRWLPVAVGATFVALAILAVGAMLGPIGVARRSVWSAEPRIDVPVATIGILGMWTAIALPAALGMVRPRPLPPGRRLAAPGGPILSVGTAFVSHAMRRRATASVPAAVLAAGVALGAVVAAGSVSGSLDRVIAEPGRYGAPYDGMIPAASGQPVVGELASVAGATRFVGSDFRFGEELVWTQANLDVDGYDPVSPTIFAGRAPATDDEIVLAPRSMADLSLSLGDRVEGRSSEGEPTSFSVVGVAPVTDGYEANVGHGALVTEGGLRRLDPSAVLTGGGDVAVRFNDDVDRALAVSELREAHPDAYVPFPVPSTLQNAARLAPMSRYLAGIAALLATVTLVHGVHVLVRGRGHELAVLRALGYERRHVFSVVVTMASALGAMAAVVGIAVGVGGSARGWSLVADLLGVDRAELVPLTLLISGSFVTVALGVMAALVPAWRSARTRAAGALRTG